jgi:transcription-repair coupling factor (superfamily II helicase)
MDLSGLLPLLDAPEPGATFAPRPAGAPPLVLGVPDGAKAAVLAALAARAPGPVLVVTAKADRALALAEELAVWLGDAERVVPFPDASTIPYERVAPDYEAAEARLRALRRLQTHRPGAPVPVLVAAARAVAQRTIAPDALDTSSLALRVGARLPMRELLAALERLGYLMEPLVESPGQAARRGGIVDVFPPDADRPLRLELLGDRLDSLRTFDPATQRTTALLTEAVVGPAREAQLDRARARALRDRLDLSAVQHGLRPRFAEELEALGAGERTDPGYFAPFLLTATVFDHLPHNALVVLDEPSDIVALLDDLDAQAAEERAAREAEGVIPRGLPLPHVPRAEVAAAWDAAPRVVQLRRWAAAAGAETDAPEPAPLSPPGTLVLPFGPATTYGGRLRAVLNDVAALLRAGRRVVIVSQQAARLAELFEAEGPAVGIAHAVAQPPPPGSLTLLQGALGQGWTLDLPDGPLALITDRELFGFTKQPRAVHRAARGREAFLAELAPGDFVVHVEHGIARFAGMTRRTVEHVEREYLELHYAEGDRLFVPTDQVDRVSRWIGPSDHRPHITRLGSGDWARTKERVRRAVTDLARELLQLYAAREVLPGHAFAADTVWQQELEGAFPYVETPDQLGALAEIKADMERPRPMDRVVIGDVGYGKTELAVRAAFKAVMDGRQVAVLVPTTVLAQQHYQTFSERMSGFPVRVEVLSRFRSERDQQAIVADLRAGKIDVLIGTHRILQRDVTFKDLGLVVIDEEQRFGVAHKEQLKALRLGGPSDDGAARPPVDVLTLSATPIPRTLHMALSGIRDMSTLDTAPEERLPIRTYVLEYDERLIREAILRELDRGGQVYFVHNRVYNIEIIAERLRELVPEAEIAVGHGQMPEEMLEQVMVDFQRGAIDVLVCTTIIESGLDIPNVNTIIINQADRLGLAQLYQLRGRVGRGAHRAYAYLMYDRHHALSETAQKRLQAIFEATELGAGFQIALRDLEIRGAGNLLGAEQSGHIGAVGYELYQEMLADAVQRLRALQQGRPPPPPPPLPVAVDLPLSAHLPEPYIPDLNLRLSVYQRLSRLATPAAVEEAAAELADRFGPPPPVVRNLLDVVRVRVLARGAGLLSVTTEDDAIVLRAGGPIARRERLAGAFGEAVRVGSAQVRVERRAGWRDVLLQVLERLQPEWAPPAPAAAPAADYGTFAPEPSARRDGRAGRRFSPRRR